MRERRKSGPTRTLAQLSDTIEWKSGFPPEHGYYLIAWVNPSLEEHISVSEAWYNPDSIMPWWWNRGYTGEPKRYGVSGAIQYEVIAWAPMPNPPKIMKKQR